MYGSHRDDDNGNMQLLLEELEGNVTAEQKIWTINPKLVKSVYLITFYVFLKVVLEVVSSKIGRIKKI